MKYTSIFLLILLSFTFLGCEDDDDGNQFQDDIIGTWQLRQFYGDPGDGSGTFEDIDSVKELIFSSDSLVVSNMSICQLADSELVTTTASFNVESMTITTDCLGNNPIRYERDGNTLTLFYPCIETCAARYQKIAD